MTISDSQSSSSSSVHDSLIGNLVANRYSVISRVAKGGTAVIYQALDTVLNREVAVKILHEHLENRQEVVQRLKREAQLIAQVRHPNILTVYDFVQHQGRAVLVVEYMPGTTLSGVIQSTEKIPEDYVLMISLDILHGLKAAHDAGITHRDIKPANVLVHSELGVKISDFGLAKILDSEDGLTKEGVFVGTPSFSSPEQIEGRPVDHRSDLFSLGLTMYMLSTRTHAFKNKGDSTTTVWYKTVKGVFDPIRDRNPLISQEFEKIVLKALQVDLDKRYSSADKMIEDVENLLKKRSLIPYKESLKKFLKEPTKAKSISKGDKNFAYKGAIGFFIAVILFGAGYFYYKNFLSKPIVSEVKPVETIPPVEPEKVITESEKIIEAPVVEETEPEFVPTLPRPVTEPVKKQPKKIIVPEIKGAPLLSSEAIIVLRSSDVNWNGRINWKKGNSFKLFSETNKNKALVSTESDKKFWDLSSLKPGKYFWDASGEKGNLEVISYDEYQKKYHQTRRPLVVSSNFADVDVEMNPWVQDLRFSWHSAPEAASYRIEIASDEAFANILFTGTSNEKSLRVERSWTRDQALYWKISFIDDQKNVFFVDRVRKLNLKLKGFSPMFEILNPPKGSQFGKDITITFAAPANSQIDCRESSNTTTDKDFAALALNGTLYTKTFSLTKNPEGVICRAKQSNQLFFFWL